VDWFMEHLFTQFALVALTVNLDSHLLTVDRSIVVELLSGAKLANVWRSALSTCFWWCSITGFYQITMLIFMNILNCKMEKVKEVAHSA